MLKAGLIVVFGVVATPMALAQPDGSSRRPGAAAGKTIEKPLAQTRTPTSCAAFGPGFVKVEGSDTCVRIGGSVSVGVGTRAR